MGWIRSFGRYLVHAVTRPKEQLSNGQQQVRNAWELTRFCARRLTQHRAEGMAAELTYRTIFSLVPVVVLGLVVFRVFGGLDDVQVRVENQLYSFFGVPEIPTDYLVAEPEGKPSTTPSVPVAPEDDATEGDSAAELIPGVVDTQSETPDQATADATDPGASSSATDAEAIEERTKARAVLKARASIRRTLQDLTGKIASLDFASIGVIGLVLFVYAAVALLDSLEYLFNRIFDAPSQRPIHLRVAIHWSIITLGSGLLALSLYLTGQVVDWAGDIGAGARPLWILRHLMSMLASWVLLFLLYALMPNTRVNVRAAAIGAAISAVMWEIGKYGFQVYVSVAVPYSALYGSLGLIPLFLFWIYVTWYIVLFGLILTETLQTLRGRRVRVLPDQPTRWLEGDPDWMLPIMSEVARAFDRGDVIDDVQLAEQLGLPRTSVREMVTKLVEEGWLRRTVDGDGEAITLSQPKEKILLVSILELAHRHRPTRGHDAWRTLQDLKSAERVAAGRRTLADVLESI